VSENTGEQHFFFGAWRYDIQFAFALIQAHPRDPVQIDVADWASFYGLDAIGTDRIPILGPGPDFDPAYALTTDLHVPVILATLDLDDKGRAPLLIDGTHRLYRAHTEHRTHLPAYVLDVAESLAIRNHARSPRR
jgi:hypothetical protein